MFFDRPSAEAEEPDRKGNSTVDFGSITAKGDRGVIHCITIIGQIEGHHLLPSQTKSTKYEHILPQLVAIEESPEIEGLLVLLNTVGGDVEAGLAIAEMIAGMRKPTVSLILGGGHSIGVPLAVSAKQSFIVPSATMTLHPVRFNGLVIGVSQTFSYFQQVQERIINFIVDHSNIDDETLRKYLFTTDVIANDVGTVIDGKQAVGSGIIDRLGGLGEALDCLYELIKKEKAEQG